MPTVIEKSRQPLCGLLLLALGCAPAAPPAGPATATATASVTLTADQAEPTTQGTAAAVDKPAAVPALEVPAADGHNQLSEADVQAGWIRLFDGHTLFGWKPNSATAWRVENGVIIGADGDEKGLLQTTTRWADYELRCEFRIAEGGNSGIFLRTPFTPKNPATDCYELNVCDSHPQFKSGSLVGRAQPTKPLTGNGDWHRFEVTVQGPRVQVKFDGEAVVDYTDETAAPLTSGFIGLQMNGGQAEFRNIYLRPLGTTPFFDGQTLDGWRVVPGSKGTFTVDEGTIRVKGAPEKGSRGFLETTATAANFVFQFEAITHGDALNSGVFFRAQPGTEAAPSNGYEFQIQSGIKNNDRNQPADFGTGAIFRRVAARRVVSSDRQWFTGTLVADGPRITTWVNGIPVVDWTDERPANDNPREGLALKPGHLSLQNHDPTTDLQFRNLRWATLP